jgi:hypothetical protein
LLGVASNGMLLIAGGPKASMVVLAVGYVISCQVCVVIKVGMFHRLTVFAISWQIKWIMGLDSWHVNTGMDIHLFDVKFIVLYLTCVHLMGNLTNTNSWTVLHICNTFLMHCVPHTPWHLKGMSPWFTTDKRCWIPLRVTKIKTWFSRISHPSMREAWWVMQLRRTRELRYSCPHSLLRRYIKVRGQHHAPASLPPAGIESQIVQPVV